MERVALKRQFLAEDDWGSGAVQGGMSIREFCRQRRVKESQFYWWLHKLKVGQQERMRKSVRSQGAASFALVSDEAGMTDARIELVLRMDVGCASSRVWRRRPCGRGWQPLSHPDVEFSGGDQGLPVRGAVRHAPLF